MRFKVFEGGFKENDPRESRTLAWQVIDNVGLSMRSRQAQELAAERGEEAPPSPFIVPAHEERFDAEALRLLGEDVTMVIHGVRQERIAPYTRHEFTIRAQFHFGQIEDFTNEYLHQLRMHVQKLGEDYAAHKDAYAENPTPDPLYTTEIWLESTSPTIQPEEPPLQSATKRTKRTRKKSSTKKPLRDKFGRFASRKAKKKSSGTKSGKARTVTSARKRSRTSSKKRGGRSGSGKKPRRSSSRRRKK